MATMYEGKKHLKSAWVAKAKANVVIKPWGKEKTWTGFSGVHGKILFVDKGKKTSLKFHKVKSEVLFLKVGKAQVVFGNECSFEDPVGNPMQTDILLPGDTLLVQSGCPYRIIALEDSEIIEIGNYMSDQPIRVLDDYDRESKEIETYKEVVSEYS